MRTTWIAAAFLNLSIGILGCGDGGAGDAILKRRSNLSEIAAGYNQFASNNQKGPSSAAELTAFMQPLATSSEATEDAIASLEEGEIVVNYGGVLYSEPESKNYVLAFEARAPASGGYVAMADGTVRLMTGKEFSEAAMLPAAP